MIEKKKLTKEEKEIKKKKKFLKKFYWDTKELEKLENKLEKINIKIESIKTSNISSIPNSGLSQDIGDLLGQQEEYKQQIVKRIIKLEKNRQDIESSIDTLEDSRLRLILRYSYLEDYSYKEISDELKKSERHIRRLHDIAIRLMRIVKNKCS